MSEAAGEGGVAPVGTLGTRKWKTGIASLVEHDLQFLRIDNASYLSICTTTKNPFRDPFTEPD